MNTVTNPEVVCPHMVRRQYKMRTDIDTLGLVASFLFGLFVGVGIAYPALPRSLQMWRPAVMSFDAHPVGTPLLLGVAFLAFFFVSVFVLNWLFMEAAE